jgi:branched-chain amino acid transport system substrate-binding protein
MRRKIALSVMALVLVGTLAFVGCSRGAESQQSTVQSSGAAGVIKIGVAGAHSGDLASYGIPSIHAVELVAEAVNARGGIDGRMIELLVEDDQCKSEIANSTAVKLVGDGAVAVIGHICSGASAVALEVYNDEQIVTISPSATNPPLTQSGDNPVFFRTIAPDDAQGQLQARFAAQELGLTKVAVLHDGGDYGKGLADFAKLSLETEFPNVEVVLYDAITPGAVDYSAIISRIANAGAEGVIYGGYHPEASKLVGQMRDRGMTTVAFISGDGVKDDTFIQVAGADAEGVYASGPRDTSANPMAQQAERDHQAKYGEGSGAFFMNAYAAMLALVNAIDKADSTEGPAIMEALRSNYVDTPLGSISFDERGDAIGVGFAVYQVQNGKYVELQ